MPIAAVPAYLGQNFKDASPGLRFGMYLAIWTDRHDQEREVGKRAEARSREGQELAAMLQEHGMEAAIAALRQRNKLPGLWEKNDHAARQVWEGIRKLSQDDRARLQALVNDVLADATTFTRLHARAAGESGPRWGLAAPTPPEPLPLADRAEKAVVEYLLNRPLVTTAEVEQAVRQAFPGLITPRRALLQAILASYGQEVEAGADQWQLRPQDQPNQRRRDLQAVAHALHHLGTRLGYLVEGENPLLWRQAHSGEVRYAFYLLASAMVWRFLVAPYPRAHHHVLVLPGSRAGLLAYKMQRDPRLAAALQRGWHVLKFRHLHRMASQADLGHDLWEALLDSDPPLWRETAQMSMF
jgi:hypothetical protein